jgi:hypothetical protein
LKIGLTPALLAVEAHRDRLATLGVGAGAGDVAHLHDLEPHQRLVDLQGFGDDGSQGVGVGAVDDVEVLAVGESAEHRRVRRAGQRGGQVPPDVFYLDVTFLSIARSFLPFPPCLTSLTTTLIANGTGLGIVSLPCRRWACS